MIHELADIDRHVPTSWIAKADDGAIKSLVSLIEEAKILYTEQKDHPVYRPLPIEMFEKALSEPNSLTNMRELVTLMRTRSQHAVLMEADPFNHGHEPDAWDEIDWLVCQKRVENPGVVIKPLIMGGNGGGKTYFCASRFVRSIVENKDWLAWAFSYDEQSSRRIPQPAVHRYLPLECRPETGKLQKTAKTKINYNSANGFTDNTFSPPSGTVTEFRFYSSDIEKMEGPRPHTVWWDEESSIPWVDAMTARLHSRAEGSKAFTDDFKRLLLAKKVNPKMKFPKERLKDLYLGVNMGSFTPTRGYTATVKRYMDGGTVVRTVDAELLPLKDKDGNFSGYEKMPKVVMCEDPTAFVYFLHAWDNPFGGNWEGMKISAKKKTREEILWWVYGIATKTAGTPFPMFSRAAHVRPLESLTKSGTDLTFYHTVDPVANGGRAWFMQWIAINPLNEKFIIREFPQRGEFIEGVGTVGEWALHGW